MLPAATSGRPANLAWIAAPTESIPTMPVSAANPPSKAALGTGPAQMLKGKLGGRYGQHGARRPPVGEFAEFRRRNRALAAAAVKPDLKHG